ncbi:unnamed protein product, partial [Rotaria magnacalcarata]
EIMIFFNRRQQNCQQRRYRSQERSDRSYDLEMMNPTDPWGSEQLNELADMAAVEKLVLIQDELEQL